MQALLSLCSALPLVAAGPAASHADPAPGAADVVDTAVAAGSFGTLAAALEAADLIETLKGEGPFTVLAPTDEAFAALPAETLQALLRPRNREALTQVLTLHVVAGDVSAAAAAAAGSARSLSGETLAFSIREGRLGVRGARVVENDVSASNGRIHVIDAVLLPEAGLSLAPERPPGRLVIGVYDERPSAALAAQLRLDRDASRLITGIVRGSEAEKAGLRDWDVVVTIDGEPAAAGVLAEAKERVGFGGVLELEVIRGGERRVVHVAVGVERH